MTANTADLDRKDKEKGLHDDVRPPKDFAEYDRKWLERYRELSFQMSLYTAIAGATFFGMFSTFSKMLLDKAAEENVDFHKTKTPLAMGVMMAMGVMFAYASTRKEAQRQKLEDDRLAHRIVAGKEALGTDAGAMAPLTWGKTAFNAPILEEKPSAYWRNQVKNRTDNAREPVRSI